MGGGRANLEQQPETDADLECRQLPQQQLAAAKQPENERQTRTETQKVRAHGSSKGMGAVGVPDGLAAL